MSGRRRSGTEVSDAVAPGRGATRWPPVGAGAPTNGASARALPGRLAHDWATAIAQTRYAPGTIAELTETLLPLADRLLTVTDPDSPVDTGLVEEAGDEAGRRLVDEHFTDPAALEHTMVVLGAVLHPEGPHATTLAALAAGYVTALRERTLTEQESIRQAALAAQERAERALRESEARFRAVFHGAAFGIALSDLSGRVLEVNPALSALAGVAPEQLHGVDMFALVHPDDRAEVRGLVDRRVTAGSGRVSIEKRFVGFDGSSRWMHMVITVIGAADNRPGYLLSIGVDVTRRHQLAERLSWQADHDTLTGLANRAVFTQRLHRACVGAQPQRRVGLCFLDLDGFKIINDSLGHDIGDQLLCQVGSRLQAATSDGHLLARLGGDEFVVLVTDSAGQRELVELAERLLAALAGPFTVAGHELVVAASVGIVERSAYGAEPAELMRCADITLYWAKEAGKSRWAIFDADRDTRQSLRRLLADTLPGAPGNGEFDLVFQPVVSLHDGTVHIIRATPYWQHPRLGRLATDDFLSVAEETGQAAALARWVLDAACAAAREWPDRPGACPPVSVSLSSRQVDDPDLVEAVQAALDKHQLPASRLRLELTETALMGAEPLAPLRPLTEAGVHILVDEFGTGYSNLGRLRRAPVHGIALAASFTASFDAPDHPDRVDLAIARSLISLGHTLGLRVSADGVATQRQADRLVRVGCDWARGSLFGPPVAAADIDTLLSDPWPTAPS